MRGVTKRLTLIILAMVAVLVLGLLITYQVIHIDWISFMEIQPSFRPMEDPLPVPALSVPIQGAAYVPETGNPENPFSSDPASVGRGQSLYEINCEVCHGKQGKGDGPVAKQLVHKPADLTGAVVKPLSDGEIFLVITDGVQLPKGSLGGMPALRENLTVNDRWDVVNYVRSLQGQ